MTPSSLATTALTTYAAAKARLNVSGSAIVDADHQNEVERLINAVSAAAENYCGRPLAYISGHVQRERVPDGQLLILDLRPVHSITSISIDGTAVAAADYAIEDAERGRIWADGGWGGRSYEDATGINETIPNSGPLALVATYTGGYVTAPQEAASATGGATLDTRTGTGAGAVTGTAGAGATGTLVVDVDPGVNPYDLTLTWDGGTPYVAHDVSAATLQAGIDLATVDSALAGLTWTMTSVVGLTALAESWDIVPASPASRTLPWDIEEAVLECVAASWRLRQAGYAGDGATEKNTAIGRGVGGLLTDRAMDVLAAYRRSAL